MTRDDFDWLAAMVAERTGRRLKPERAFLFDTRLAPVARRENFASVAVMLATLREGLEDRLGWAVADALADPETCFFRDRAPFDQFRDVVLPAMSRARGGAPVKVWSAGCGTGQEPYSIAMAALQAAETHPAVKIELTATDLSERALEKGAAGLYSHFEVQRGLPITLLLEHFEKAEDMWRVSPRLRQSVRWSRLNLMDDPSGLGEFDVVFCRNVLPDFEDEARARVLAHIAAVTAPGGVLFLGDGETAEAARGAFKALGRGRSFFQRDPGARTAA